MSAALIERDDEVDLVLTVLIASEHVLLVGRPGRGKSLLLDSVLSWTGGTKFSILLKKFTTPDEVFGPVSLAALTADRYVRVTAGRLPGAEYAFLDEGWNAPSAVLNTLLKVLNERVYDAGDGTARPVPLKLCVAAATSGRRRTLGRSWRPRSTGFVLRKAVSPIRSRAGRQKLLGTRDHVPKFSSTVTLAEDFLAAAFDPDPRLVESCADPRRHRFLAQLLDTPEYRALHPATRLDDTAAAIPAVHFAEQFAALRKEDEKDPAAVQRAVRAALMP